MMFPKLHGVNDGSCMVCDVSKYMVCDVLAWCVMFFLTFCNV